MVVLFFEGHELLQNVRVLFHETHHLDLLIGRQPLQQGLVWIVLRMWRKQMLDYVLVIKLDMSVGLSDLLHQLESTIDDKLTPLVEQARQRILRLNRTIGRISL